MSLNRYILAFFVVVLFNIPTSSFAHLATELLYCPVFAIVGATHVPKFLKSTILPNGILGETYDVTGDGKADIATYSAIADGETDGKEPYHQDIPIFYEVNLDDDLTPDALYIDPKGFGKCEDLVLYSEEQEGGLMSWKPGE